MLRNGISFLIIAVNFLLADYYISFDFVSKNGILTSFNFNCSPVMHKILYKNKILIFKIDTTIRNINILCAREQKRIIKNLINYKFHITSSEIKGNNKANFKIKGVFLPERFDIIIRHNNAYFYLIKPN